MVARAVIFDLDGTLVDSLADIGDAMNACLIRAGLPTHELAAYRALVGEGMEALVRKSAPDGHDVTELLADMRHEYADRLCVRTRPFAGFERVLEELARTGTRLSILSNKPHELTVRLVERLFAPGLFLQVVGHRPEFPRKPDPASALWLAKALGVAPTDCLFVGDTPIDMQTARAANMIGIGVPWGFRDREQLLAAGAVEVIDDPDRLLALVR